MKYVLCIVQYNIVFFATREIYAKSPSLASPCRSNRLHLTQIFFIIILVYNILRNQKIYTQKCSYLSSPLNSHTRTHTQINSFDR